MEAQTSKGIPFSRINPRYLHSNATSHAWPFGAIAELIDNAYDPDASAKKLWIDKLVMKGQDCLIFMDNGNGMDYEKLHKMLSFGFSEKQRVGDHVPIGVYGNGFKSGSMRLGKDAIVFSKKENTMCVGLLSQTYLERTSAQNVIVPIVEFTNTGQIGHEPCLRDILMHSLFNTKEEILKEFSIIDELGSNSSGTRIIIWNLTRCPTGELELDFIKDPDDIRILDEVYNSFRERNKRQTSGAMSVPESGYSLRAYCSILYLKPRMEIILREQKVETQSVIGTLAKARTDTYRPDRSKETIKVTFGYNKNSKECYGLMMYHKNRLIKAYEPVACQRKQNNQTGEGVIGVIECNYLTPTHNKQDFEVTREYRNTLTNLNQKLEQYFYGNRYCYSAFKPAENTESCTVDEEPEDSDEQCGYKKTHKEHEKNLKLQEENKSKQQNLSITSPAIQTTPSSPVISQAPSGSSLSDDTSVDFHVISVSTTPKSKKRNLSQSQEITVKNKATRRNFDKNISDSPPTSIEVVTNLSKTSPSIQTTPSSPVIFQAPSDSSLSDDTSVDSHEISVSTTTKRKKRALGQSKKNTKSKTRAKRNDFDKNISDSPSTSIASPQAVATYNSHGNTFETPDNIVALTDNSDNMTDKSTEQEQSNQISHISSEYQQNDDVQYLQEEVKKLQLKVKSLEDEKCDLMSYCESLKKELEEIKRESEKAKISVEDQFVHTDSLSSVERSAAILVDSQFGTPYLQAQDM